MGNELFQEVVEKSGLSPVFAANALRRDCIKSGVDPDKLTRKSLATVLPSIRRTVIMFLGDNADMYIRSLEDLL